MRLPGAVLCLLALTACSTTTVESYRRVPDARVDQAYVKPGVDFSRYSRLYAWPLEIYYADGASAPRPEALERMREIFRKAFLDELGEDYEIAAKPAADALGVRASLVDLRSGPMTEDLPIQGRLRTLVANGQLTFLMELSDSRSGEILARAADREKPPLTEPAVPETDWEAAVREARRWAKLFREFLDDNLAR